MDKDNKTFRNKVFSHLFQLSQESPAYEDAKMLVGSADTVVSLKNNTVRRTIDTEWIEKIEYAIPYLDAFIRNPGIQIEEIEEVLPVEATKKVGEKSIRYLAQHTNHILKIEEDEVTPSKLLNIFRDESLLTYENKFINTLLIRLIAFIEKRFSVLNGTSGIENNYVFDYQTSFEHSFAEQEKNFAKMTLKIELTSPVKENLTQEDEQKNAEYAEILQRLEKIRSWVMSFMSSPLIRALGKNYIRPPVIRTNPILKNKNLYACLTLWEYIESVDKTGFWAITDEFKEMPSDDYVSELYSSVALQYLQFYFGVVGEDADNRLLSERRVNETFPDFESELDLKEIDEYVVYDTDYKKLVSSSLRAEKRRKLSQDERKMRVAIEVALRADRVIFDAYMAEEEAKRKAEEERLAKQEQRKNIQYRYLRSYLARLIQSEDLLKQSYGAIKNKLLSYQKVKSRISKKYEAFNCGRNKLAKINVKGKKIYLYLALDPNEFGDKAKFYNFIDVSDKKQDTPMLIKVNGPIKLRRALELIEILAKKQGIELQKDYAEQDFYMPYEDTDSLVRRGLIIDLWNQTSMEEPAEEEIEAEEIIEKEKLKIKARYLRSYLARLIQSSDEVKGRYATIKNKLLIYKKVKARISKKCETFYTGRNKLAKINVKGKKIYLYLALAPNEFADKAKFYNFVDVSDKKQDTPMLIKVNGPIKLRRALELIEILVKKQGIELQKDYAEQDFYMPYEDTQALIEKGLVVDTYAKKEDESKEEFLAVLDTVAVAQDEEKDDVVLDEDALGENEGFIQGVRCVFKPYFERYEECDSVIIPVDKETFNKFSERKKARIFSSAFKKNKKRLKKKLK